MRAARCSRLQVLMISGCMLLSRVHAFESQFNESGALKFGVQEVRAKEEQFRAGVCYQMVVAAATGNGSYGVQAWFRVSCCQHGQPSSDGCCCEIEQVVGLRDILIGGSSPTSETDLEDRSILVKQAI